MTWVDGTLKLATKNGAIRGIEKRHDGDRTLRQNNRHHPMEQILMLDTSATFQCPPFGVGAASRDASVLFLPLNEVFLARPMHRIRF
jgi:hypothetical protein